MTMNNVAHLNLQVTRHALLLFFSAYSMDGFDEDISMFAKAAAATSHIMRSAVLTG